MALEARPSFVSSELEFGRAPRLREETLPRDLVTIARQSGCGAVGVGEKLAAFLESHAPDASCPWKIFDQHLVEVRVIMLQFGWDQEELL